MKLPRIAVVTALCGFLPGLMAHDFSITSVAVILQSDGSYQIEMAVDADAVALGLDPSTDSDIVAEQMSALSDDEFEQAVERAKEALRDQTQILFDGQDQAPAIEFPHHGTPAATEAEIPTVLGTIARMQGSVPPGAENFAFRADPAFKVVDLRIFDPAVGATTYTLRPGEHSPPYILGEGRQPGEQNAFLRYLALGFEHILPKGLDHILFVLGLFLLSAHVRPLLWQVTAFTIAHSVTLALSMLDIVSLPSKPVETLIALSIAYVAIENIATGRLKPWRPFVVFAFGLLHGLGFAGVLQELGAPQDRFLSALVGFNLGVEAGQLAVLALAFLAVGWFRDKSWYRRAIVIPASLAIALVGLYWAVERAAG